MRIEHATLGGQIIVTELPDEPMSAEPIEAAARRWRAWLPQCRSSLSVSA